MYRMRIELSLWIMEEISGFDSHENLIKTNEIYREVYESQTKGGGDFDENGGE